MPSYIEQSKANVAYIDKHRELVQEMFNQYGDKLCKALSIDKKRLYKQVQIHDDSKYGASELEGYRLHFYRSDDDTLSEDEAKAKFDEAWMHHVQNNPHHPEFWIYKTDDGKIAAYPMPRTFIAEMLLDWAAVGTMFNEDPIVYHYWTEGTGKKKPFNPETFELVDSVINLIFKP